MRITMISPELAKAIDVDLMGKRGFCVEQLMELAGLSCARAFYLQFPLPKYKNVTVISGPGNNGGDGLVAARHLALYGYHLTVVYPKPSESKLFNGLETQLRGMSSHVKFLNGKHDDVSNTNVKSIISESDCIIDAIFGFSFRKDQEIRQPFSDIIDSIKTSKKPVFAIDAPSSWTIDEGQPKKGPGKDYYPEGLISLTAPKKLAQSYKMNGKGKHWLGGRFVSQEFQQEYKLELPEYKGTDIVVDITEAEFVGLN